MLQYDLSFWPLVLTASRGQPSLQELEDYADAWSGWLARGERFAILQVLFDEAAHSHPPGGAKVGKNWLTNHREPFSAQVLGMATVAPADLAQKMNKMKTDRLYGNVPKRAFTGVDAALDWLLPLLAAGVGDGGLGADTDALKAQVLRTVQRWS